MTIGIHAMKTLAEYGETRKSSENAALMTRLSRLVLLFFLMAVMALPSTATAADYRTLRLGDAAPRAVLPNLKGGKISFPDQYRGKVVIIHFWAVGCSSCKREMSTLESLRGEYSGKGLVILAINVGQDKKLVDKAARNIGISYDILLDADRSIADKYEVVGIPRTFILDRKGKIHYKIVGEADEVFLKKRILSLL